jgi:hypothetical protein
VPAGDYSLFIDLNGPTQWTLIVSSWPAQLKFDPKDKAALWGAYGYTPDKDVARIPMKADALPFAASSVQGVLNQALNNCLHLTLTAAEVNPTLLLHGDPGPFPVDSVDRCTGPTRQRVGNSRMSDHLGGKTCE